MSARVPALGPDERRLIVCGARLELPGPLLEELAALAEARLDWASLLLHAKAHSVASLLHRHLRRVGASSVPAGIRAEWRRTVHGTACRNRFFTDALREALGVLAGAGVPVIVLKGPALLELVYRDPALRPLIDLDFLVPPGQFDRARSALRQAGCLDLGTAGCADRSGPPRAILVRAGDVTIDILVHRRYGWPEMHAIDLDRMWQDARAVRLAGTATLVPAPTDLVHYLCLQAHKYGYLNAAARDVPDPSRFILDERTHNRLIRFTDLYETIRRSADAIDWDELGARARASGTDGWTGLACRWTNEVFGPCVPSPFLQACRAPKSRLSRRWMFRALTAAASGAAGPSPGSLVARWWSNQPERHRQRWIRTMDRLELMFPTLGAVGLKYRPGSRTRMLSEYGRHTVRTACFIGADLLGRRAGLMKRRLGRLAAAWSRSAVPANRVVSRAEAKRP